VLFVAAFLSVADNSSLIYSVAFLYLLQYEVMGADWMVMKPVYSKGVKGNRRWQKE
jgi:hypothetical protein